MAYVAVKGGEQAIEESLRRLKYERVKKGAGVGVDQIEQGMRLLVDQVMSEGSLAGRGQYGGGGISAAKLSFHTAAQVLLPYY